MQEQARCIIVEALRVLKPGGFLVLSSFGYMKSGYHDGKTVFNDGLRQEDIVTLREIEELLEKCGFDDIREMAATDFGDESPSQHLFVEAGGFVARKP